MLKEQQKCREQWIKREKHRHERNIRINRRRNWDGQIIKDQLNSLYEVTLKKWKKKRIPINVGTSEQNLKFMTFSKYNLLAPQYNEEIRNPTYKRVVIEGHVYDAFNASDFPTLVD